MNSIELFSLLIPFRKSDSIWLNGVLILYSFSQISDWDFILTFIVFSFFSEILIDLLFSSFS